MGTDAKAPETAAHLGATEADLARSQLGRGLNPDRGARSRVARGPAVQLPERRDSVAGLLDALERERR